MSLIDNQEQSMLVALRNALSTARQLDALVGYFYMSGFSSLAEEIAEIDIRVLVGMELEPDLIPLIAQESRRANVNLERFQPRTQTTSKLARRRKYVDALVGFINDSDNFDDDGNVANLRLFLRKIEDGSLRIRRTVADEHGKMYLTHNREDLSHNGDFPGTRFIGSSNFTLQGLVAQGELNASEKDMQKFLDGRTKFDELWQDGNSIEIADSEETRRTLVAELKKRIWTEATPTPYELYLRVLLELFDTESLPEIQTPSSITNGRYWDLQYQLDAIRLGIDRINKFGGVILADVAGLGKSVIGSAIARNLDMRTVIVAPPHLIDEWEDYKEDFGIRGSRVFSSGKITELTERYKSMNEPLLIIIDEAHRFRNEETSDYKQLHQLTRSHPENKVVLLTATPFNNAPKDVFALVRLFQTPGRATIRTVEKLGLRFRELVGRYELLRRSMSKGLTMQEIDREAREIAAEQRLLIDPIVVRRSRLDLASIDRYRLDLERQGVSFARVVGPQLIEYPLGTLAGLYLRTLDGFVEGSEGGFLGARYRSANYISDREAFIDQFGDDIDDADLRVAQDNLATFMRRLLVTRFESSRAAFGRSLETMIAAHELVLRWWDDVGLVPIMKKGRLPDPLEFDDEPELGPGDISEFDRELQLLKQTRGLICIPIGLMSEQFRVDVGRDLEFLRSVRSEWFEKEVASDPKLDGLKERLKRLLEENPNRKVVIFSMYADTVEYLTQALKQNGFDHVLAYTSERANRRLREVVKQNFDASLATSGQRNDYQVLVATDALSEGFNLHRAGVIVNYDIPYNPTRVVQRIGRINRIDKKTFDEILVLNSFPSDIGEGEVRIKEISTLKMKLINLIVGSDHKTLTSDEELISFFKDQFEQAEAEAERLSWDVPHRKILESMHRDEELLSRIKGLPNRARVRRAGSGDDGLLVFGRRGSTPVFAWTESSGHCRLIDNQTGVEMFACDRDGNAQPVTSEFPILLAKCKGVLFGRDPLSPVKGRREKAISVLQGLQKSVSESHGYCQDLITVIKEFDDLSDGHLREIAMLDLSDSVAALAELKRAIPEYIVENTFKRSEVDQADGETILVCEELSQ